MLTPEAGGDSHMKQTGMLVVAFRVFRAKRQYFMYARVGYDDHDDISLKPFLSSLL